MLRRTASLLSAGAAWGRCLLRLPVTPSAGLARHHPEACAGLRPPAPIPHLGAVGARGYARMARRIPPTRPDGYSTSDGETAVDSCEEDEDLQPDAGADGEERPPFIWEDEGMILDLATLPEDLAAMSDEDGNEDEDEDVSDEEEK